MTCHIGSDKDVIGIGRVDRDSPDRAAGGNRAVVARAVRARSVRARAACYQRPALAAIGRLVKSDSCLGVARAIRLTGTGIECLPARIEGEGADRVRWNAAIRGMPVWLRIKRVVSLPHAAIRRPNEGRTAFLRGAVGSYCDRRCASGVDCASRSACGL